MLCTISSSRWGICICADYYVLMYKYNYATMSMTAWCDQTKNTTSSIIKLRVIPTEENSRTGFKMLPTALTCFVNMLLKHSGPLGLTMRCHKLTG